MGKKQPGLAINGSSTTFVVPASATPTTIRVSKVPKKAKLTVQTLARLEFCNPAESRKTDPPDPEKIADS